MKKKIEVWTMTEGDGVGISNRCTQEEAFETIKQYYLRDELEPDTACRVIPIPARLDDDCCDGRRSEHNLDLTLSVRLRSAGPRLACFSAWCR